MGVREQWKAIQRWAGVTVDGIPGVETALAIYEKAGLMTERTISKEGLDLIKSFEGLSLKAYPDPGTGGAPWTIGYGHTGPDVSPGLVITEAKADELLRKDVARFEQGVRDLAGTHGTQHQFDALVSFAFNVGLENLRRSTLLRKHNEGDYSGAAAEFPKWNKAAGRVLTGLTRRREAEARLYRK